METFLPMIEMSVISGTIQKAVIDNVHQVGQEGWGREMAGRRTCEMQYGKVRVPSQDHIWFPVIPNCPLHCRSDHCNVSADAAPKWNQKLCDSTSELRKITRTVTLTYSDIHTISKVNEQNVSSAISQNRPYFMQCACRDVNVKKKKEKYGKPRKYVKLHT
ncbi:conserved hypothetical protein [Trichinella spiralis]|uniref:hypothetical protein n=1 Tax=Trichinella spiralis TaxID=6334 RepID=UPI0001EFCAEA|nr:conserved hypothetical protein [Trichinella spiralis]